MQVIRVEAFKTERSFDGSVVVIAVLVGIGAASGECVAVLECTAEIAEGLWQALGSVLRGADT